MVQEHILADIGAVGPVKPLHRAIPKSVFVDRRRTSSAGKYSTALPTGRHEHVEVGVIRDEIQVRALVVTEATFPGFGQGVGEDEPRRAPTLPLVGRMGTPDLRPIAQLEVTPTVDVVVEGDQRFAVRQWEAHRRRVGMNQPCGPGCPGDVQVLPSSWLRSSPPAPRGSVPGPAPGRRLS